MSVHETVSWNDVAGVRVGRFGGRVNTTSILWRLGTTIVDTGPPNQWRFVRDFISEKAVSQVVVTHHHEDHAGNLAGCRELGIDRLLAPRESIAALRDGFEIQMYRRVVWGRPRKIAPEAFDTAVELPEGGTLEALLLPGHSPDMTCLLDRERGIVFGADAYIGPRLRYLRRDENLNGIIACLEQLLAIDFDTLLCSHRGIVRPAHEKLRTKLDNLLELRARTNDLGRLGHPAERIARELLGPEDMITRLSRGHFSKLNLVLACLDPDGVVRSPSAAQGRLRR